MTELPEWDEILQRVKATDNRIATVVAQGLKNWDDTDKRMILDMLVELETHDVRKVAQVAVNVFLRRMARGDYKLDGTDAPADLVNIIADSFTTLWAKWKREGLN